MENKEGYATIKIEDYDDMQERIRILERKLQRKCNEYSMKYTYLNGYSFMTKDETLDKISERHSFELKRLKTIIKNQEEIKLNWLGRLLGKLIIK